LIISNEWQYFNQYSIESENIVNNTYTIFKENHDIETYLINSEDYPLITGNKWHFNKTDSVFYYGDIRFKIQKYQNDTIYMLNDKKITFQNSNAPKMLAEKNSIPLSQPKLNDKLNLHILRTSAANLLICRSTH